MKKLFLGLALASSVVGKAVGVPGHLLRSAQRAGIIKNWGYTVSLGYLSTIADQLYMQNQTANYGAIPELIGQINAVAFVLQNHEKSIGYETMVERAEIEMAVLKDNENVRNVINQVLPILNNAQSGVATAINGLRHSIFKNSAKTLVAPRIKIAIASEFLNASIRGENVSPESAVQPLTDAIRVLTTWTTGMTDKNISPHIIPLNSALSDLINCVGHTLSSAHEASLKTQGYRGSLGYLAAIADQLYMQYKAGNWGAIPELIGQLNAVAFVLRSKNKVETPSSDVIPHNVMLSKKYTTKRPHKN